MSMRLHLAIAGLALSIYADVSHAAGTRANSTITNTVTVNYVLNSAPRSASATATIGVDELLDVTVSWQDAANVSVLSPSSDQVLTFLVTNTGNGVEDFILNVAVANTAPQFNPINIELWADSDGDAVFNSANDTQIALGGTINLDGGTPGSDAILIFARADIPAGVNPGDIGQLELLAVSRTASDNGVAGNAGMVINNGGDGGAVDALTSMNGAQSRATGVYQAVLNMVSLSKTAVVRDNRGGNSPYPGSIITYTIQVDISGANVVDNLVIRDVIPANTVYDIAIDSIYLDDVVQTNADDAPTDFSFFDTNANRIVVDLSEGGARSIAPPTRFMIRFNVVINEESNP